MLYHAPYEVTETGWGEFEIKIVVTFKACSGLEPVTLSHMLKLFPPQGIAPSTKKPVRIKQAAIKTTAGDSMELSALRFPDCCSFSFVSLVARSMLSLSLSLSLVRLCVRAGDGRGVRRVRVRASDR